MVSYLQAEEIFAHLHGATGSAKTGALRGRVIHFRRLGLPLGIAPGSGNKISYTKDQIFQFCFCLDVSELGIDPRLAAKLLQGRHDYILHAYSRAQRALENGEDWFFVLWAEFMAARWSKETKKFPGLPEIQAGPMQIIEAAVRNGRHLAIFNMTPSVKAVSEVSEP